ncbi:MAG: hypothetical protein PF693_03715 [Spirochaetia bacterium]|jgi:hypothetical protein|nr:hypothetical protein [Spirochaetia bacterium]
MVKLEKLDAFLQFNQEDVLKNAEHILTLKKKFIKCERLYSSSKKSRDAILKSLSF